MKNAQLLKDLYNGLGELYGSNGGIRRWQGQKKNIDLESTRRSKFTSKFLKAYAPQLDICRHSVVWANEGECNNYITRGGKTRFLDAQ